jgi:glycosyltransferase involved in cell wall biosynthesis
MAEKIRLSVITPSYNQVKFIERTLDSVLNQKANFPFEIIVIDGGSTDGTLDILKKYSTRISWVSEKDKGQSDAVNKGIRMARGEIIGWLNSDDLYLPGTLQKVAGCFDNNPEAAWLYGQCNIIDEYDHEIRKWITTHKNRSGSSFSFHKLLTENYISQPAVFFRKKSIDDTGNLDPELHYAMDYDLWLRLAVLTKPIVINDCLASFRMHGSSKSSVNSRNLFTEQYAIHKKFDKNRFRLFIHRVKILQISCVYSVLALIARKNPVKNTFK